MRLKLEIEDVRFCTTQETEFGFQRWLAVDFAGKRFFAHRGFDSQFFDNGGYRNNIDSMLIQEMELMLEGIFLNALDKQPAGVIEFRCKTGEIWRNHFNGQCQCKLLESIEKTNSQPDNSGGNK